VINEDILGSMEFPCTVAGSKFILVLGHTYCGAGNGHLATLLSKIHPAIDQENTTKDDRTSKNSEFVQHVADINVKRSVEEISGRSLVLQKLANEGKIGIGGAMYDVASGNVTFYKDTILIRTNIMSIWQAWANNNTAHSLTG